MLIPSFVFVCIVYIYIFEDLLGEGVWKKMENWFFINPAPVFPGIVRNGNSRSPLKLTPILC